jgi:tetratricopeptide (TPR) repeat protein
MYKLLFVYLITFTFKVYGQPLSTLPIRGSKKAMVSEHVGLTKITVQYNRPAVKGREGMIWGELIPVGFVPLGLTKELSPWRAGANENTTIEFSAKVLVEGKALEAGKYGFHIAYYNDSAILIFSKNYRSWGSFFYKASEDALRIKVQSEGNKTSVEWLEYKFTNQTNSSASIELLWERKKISFRVETDYIHQQLELFRKELKEAKGNLWQNWITAAQWCLEQDVNLQEAESWADSALVKSVHLDSLFSPHGLKALFLDKRGSRDEALALMNSKVGLAGVPELHNYAMLLLKLRKQQEALLLFHQNHKRAPQDIVTITGLIYGYAAEKNNAKALYYCDEALKVSKNETEKSSLRIIKMKLKKGVSLEM